MRSNSALKIIFSSSIRSKSMASVEEKINPRQDYELLENAVLTKNPGRIAEVYRSLGKVDFSARALGLACRFCDVETVKTLVEHGAAFKYDEEFLKDSYPKLFNSVFPGRFPDFANFLIKEIRPFEDRTIKSYIKSIKEKNGQRLPLASDEERAKIVEYLCKHTRETGFDPGSLLYYMIASDDEKIISVLKENGAVLSEEKKKLAEKGDAVSYLIQKRNDNDVMRILSALISETGGKKPHITDRTWNDIKRRIANPELLRFFVDNFDLSNVNKSKLIKNFILSNNVTCLESAAGLGWLKQPKKRDEMIAFSAENGKTECTAFLLDHKNRTADLAAEHEKAEKKMERELNAAPDSGAALSEFWSFKKRSDGTYYIKGYKGAKTEVVVPEKIGGIPVTAIGDYAFSPEARYIQDEHREYRKAITEVVLPDSVTEIGEFAFFKCKSLTRIKLPERLTEISKGMLDITGLSEIVISGNVQKIGALAFLDCQALKKVVLCEGVEEIGSGAFFHCDDLETVEIPGSVKKIALDENYNPFTRCYKLVITLYKGSYAEQYCAQNKIPFKYKE